MKTRATIKELAEYLKQPIPYVTGFINISKMLGLVKEAGKERAGSKGKSSVVYEMPAEWIVRTDVVVMDDDGGEILDDKLEYSPEMDRDYIGDGMQDFLNEQEQPCNAATLKEYTGESEEWARRAFETGKL